MTSNVRKETLNAIGDLRNNFAPRNLSRNKKPVSWSHQKELDSLKGRKIRIWRKGHGDPLEGTLIEADQFAIKFQYMCPQNALITGQRIIPRPAIQSTMTVFKHDLSAYEAG